MAGRNNLFEHFRKVQQRLHQLGGCEAKIKKKKNANVSHGEMEQSRILQYICLEQKREGEAQHQKQQKLGGQRKHQ